MVTRAQDPTGTRTDTPDPSLSPGSSSDGSVNRDKYEADIAEERKRRSGQEKAHRKEIDGLNKKIDDLTAVLSGSGSKSGSSVPDLPDLNPNDPATAHIQHLYKNTRDWQDTIIARERAGEFRTRLSEAITEAVSSGVPLDALDDTNPEAVQSSAREFLSEKRIRDLEDQVVNLKKETETATTRARAEAGALSVSTSTGGRAAVNPTIEGIQERRKELGTDKQRLSQRGGGPAAMVELKQINRELQALEAQEQEIRAGNR